MSGISKQSKLIGSHPEESNPFGRWLVCDDISSSSRECHRALSEKLELDADLIEWLARRLITHHYSDFRIEQLKKKYSDIGFPVYAEQNRKLPRTDKVKKGNLTEILLMEYVECCLGTELIKMFKLKYNPNVDQSITGDDSLMVEVVSKEGDGEIKLYLGEAKYRGKADKKVVNDISKSLKETKNPISYSYLVDKLASDPEKKELAEFLDSFILDDIKNQGELVYTGFLLSDKNTKRCVERNLETDNSNLVFISVSIDKPIELIEKAFKRAEELVVNPSDI